MKQLMTTLLLVLSINCAHAADTIRIGLTLGLTGHYAEMANMQKMAFELWKNELNRKGGMLGRQVELIVHDDRSDPQTARQLYEQMIAKQQVDLLFAPYSSEITEAILPVTEKHAYQIITSGASADKIWQQGYRNTFGLYTVASRYSTGFLEMLTRHDLTRIAIVYAKDGFSASIADGTRYWAEKFGLKVLMFEGVPKGANLYSALAAQVKNSKADVFIGCGHFEEAVGMRQAFKAIGWQPAVFYTTVAPTLPRYLATLGPLAEHTFSTAQWEPHRNYPGSTQFSNSFRKAYNQLPSYQAADAYAAGQILEKAVTKAGTIDREQVRRMLSSMNTTSIIGRYAVNKNGRQTGHKPLIIQLQKGKTEIVWPMDMRTARPVISLKKGRP